MSDGTIFWETNITILHVEPLRIIGKELYSKRLVVFVKAARMTVLCNYVLYCSI